MKFAETYSLRERLTQLGIFSVIAVGFSIPVSTSLTSIFSILASLCWLISGKTKDICKLFPRNPVIRAALLLFALLLVGMFYSSASFSEALRGLNTYRKLFLIVIFASFMREKRHQRWAIYAFFGGCFILLGTSCVSAWKIIPSFSLPEDTMTSRITHNLFMAFLSFWLAVNFMEHKRFKTIYGLLFCLVVYNIFFVVTARTGYVEFLALIILFLCHYFDRKKLMLGLLILSVFLSSAFFCANKFSKRLLATDRNIQSYLHTGNNHSSIGQRLDFAKTSLILFTRHPLIGYGTGSFPKEYKKLSQKIGTYLTDNPHNEYLAIAVQSGLVGLLMFIYLLAVQWKYAKMLKYQTVLAQGFVLTMVVGSLMNSMLLDAGEGHFFAYFTAVLFANVTSQKKMSNPTAKCHP